MTGSGDNSQATYTIEDYLRGKVGVTVTDEALRGILADNGVQEGSAYSSLMQRTRDLCVADLYVWCSTLPMTSGSVEDKHGVWSHKEGGTSIGVSDRNRWLRMARAIYRKYGELSRIPSSGVKVSTIGMKLWQG